MNSAVVDANGPTFVRDFGGTGSPMILVHSMGSSSSEWLAVGPQLAKQHRVVALDLPGFGRSPLGHRSGSVRDGAKVVDGVIKAVNAGPAIVVGGSMGGLIASIEAAKNPGSVRALVLLNSALPLMNRLSIRRRSRVFFGVYSLPFASRLVNGYIARTGAERVLLGSLSLITADPQNVDRVALAGMLESLEEQLKFRDPMLAFSRGARSIVGHVLRRNRELARFRQIGCPVLLLHGGKDPLIRLEQAERVANALPSWQFQVLPEAGHMPQLEQPDLVAEAILRFTSSL